MQDLWNSYFADDHDKVVRETTKAMFAGSAPDLLHLSGLSLLALGRPKDALPRLRAALSLSPTPAWFANSAIATLAHCPAADALSFSEAGLALYPQDPVLHYAHGNALMADNLCSQALSHFETALGIDPEMVDARLNKGNCLRRLSQFDESIVTYDQIIARDPNHVGALINKVGALMEAGRDPEADLILEQLGAMGDIPEVDFMRSMIRLLDGDYETGWALYRRRWECNMAQADVARFRAPLAKALTDITGKHVVVSHEQGFGDSLQFCRYIPMLAGFAKIMGATVTVLVPAPLVRLFGSLDGIGRIVTSREEAGSYDLEIPMLDLPTLFGTRLDSIPATVPYLTPSAASREAHEHALAFPAPSVKTVGLCWAGQMRANPDLAAVDRRRSMSLKMMKPILECQGPVDRMFDRLSFTSLQLGAPAREYDPLCQGRHINRPLDDTFDFDATAAVIEQLDLVITVDTAVAHLAGALGKPVWILSRYDGCWRWLKDRSDSPWYPTARIFRQPAIGDWDSVVAEVAAALLEWSKT